MWSRPPSIADLRRHAWHAFVADPNAAAIMREVRRRVGRVACVVDAGCAAGQQLLPYLEDCLCVGIDTDRDTLKLGRGLMRDHDPRARASFLCGRLEALPLRAQCADVVICRVVLQNVALQPSIAELSRLLRPGGALLVMFHHQRYYLRKVRDGICSADLRPIVHGLRVLLTGTVFHLSGRQRSVLGTRETYLSHSRLLRIASTAGLDYVTDLADGSPAAPHLLFRRR